MIVIAVLAQAFRSIWGNKLRSGLTMLGVVVGILSVITLFGLGKGLQANVVDSVAGLGITRITVASQNPTPPSGVRQLLSSRGSGDNGFSFGDSDAFSLSKADYLAIKRVRHVKAASPETSTQVDVAKTAQADTALAYQLYGVDKSYFALQGYTAKQGSVLSQAQVDENSDVVVVGSKVAKDLFPKVANPVGRTVFIKGKKFTIIGVLAKESDESLTAPNGSNIYTGYGRWLSITGKKKLSSVIADATRKETVEAVAASIKTLLSTSHPTGSSGVADYVISTNQELLDTVNELSDKFTATLTDIAAISLLVGGIGIMNIMLVTVAERTREIGLRRAVGAKSRHIIMQFLIESVVLTLMGGCIGVLVGVGLGDKLVQLIPQASMASNTIHIVIAPDTVMIALGVSVAIGIIFGLFPAIRAAKLDPVEALRYE